MNYDIFSNEKFSNLEICDDTKLAIKEQLKFEYMTKIQARAIPHLLKGRDLLGAAKTGSGKTLGKILVIMKRLYINKSLIINM